MTEYALAKTWECPSDISRFSKLHVSPKIWRVIYLNTITWIWHKNMHKYFSWGVICSSTKLTIFFELHVWSQKLCTSFSWKCHQAYFCSKWRHLSTYFYMSCSILMCMGKNRQLIRHTKIYHKKLVIWCFSFLKAMKTKRRVLMC